MRLNISLPSILGATFLATLTACGGSGDVDPFALIQQQDYAGAISAIEPMLKTVEQGSEAHKDLLLGYTEALCVESPEKARDTFIAAMDSNKDLLEPGDVTYVVNRMASHKHLEAAIDVMDKGNKTWPSDDKIKTVLEELKVAVQSSGDDAALAKLKSMGYLGSD